MSACRTCHTWGEAEVRQVWRCICHTTTPLGVWGWGGAGNSSNGEVWQKKASRQGSSARGSNFGADVPVANGTRNNNITTVITAWPHPAVLGAGLVLDLSLPR
jgi:hypothetical protein